MTKNVFYGVMLDILILHKIIQEELKKKTDRRLASNPNYEGIEFPVEEKDSSKIEVQNNICINVFVYENELVFPIFISEPKFEDSTDLLLMDLLLLIDDDDKSHYVYIKDFNTFMFHKAKNKNKKWFCKSFLQCFSNEKVMIKHKEDCLSINRVQLSLKIILSNYRFRLKFMLILNVIYKILKFMKALAQKNIMIMSLVVMRIRLSVLMIDLVSRLLFIEVKMLLMNLLKQFLKNISTAKT